MNVPMPPRAGLPAVPYRPGDRRQFLATMLAELVRTKTADGQPFGLRTQAPDEPTVALLDAWATVADVIAFYQERIANEGFVATAGQAGSLLAIAQLTGYTPRPGLAARTWLAYQLQPDPADMAVVLSAGLLSQSVPGTGELPQTFETTLDLVARPSWNTLGVQATGPVPLPSGGATNLTALVVQGATTGLAANDVILVTDSNGGMTPVTVQSVTTDLANQVTSVTLQRPLRGPSATPSSEPVSITAAIDGMLPALRTQPAAPPRSASALNRGPAEVFPKGNDKVVPDNLLRLVAALNPVLAGTVYKALGTTSIGPATVTGAQVMQVQATPFGVRMPVRPVFNNQGQQIGTDEWPIGDLQILSAQIAWNPDVPDETVAQVSIEGPGGVYATIQVKGKGDFPPVTQPNGVGTLHVTSPQQGVVSVRFEPASPPLGIMIIDLESLSLTSPNATPGVYRVTVTFQDTFADNTIVTDRNGFEWDSNLFVAQHFTLGNQRVTINWLPAAGSPTGRGTSDIPLLSVSLAVALPLADAKVLDLDRVYPGILPGSWVVIDGPAASAGELTYPVVAQVKNVATSAVARYGMSGTVTELTLDKSWVDPNARWLSSVRPLSVQAQPAPLHLLPVALPGPLPASPDARATIELDGLYAGIEAGQRILVTGTRTDLPGTATVPGGEPAMVKSVTQKTAAAGDAPHTTLELAGPLTYRYDLATVRIYGNVVPAHQGATVHQPLTGATPGDRHPTFTLSQTPVLADPSATESGYLSSLRVSVNGIPWSPVPRLDPATPPNCYLTGIDSQGRTTITLSGPLPTGTSQVVATYRSGDGRAGNVRAHQVTQLLSRPLTVAGVDNPMPGTGGSAGDGPANLKAGASVGLTALGRIVTIDDATDLARAWSGVSQARAQTTTDGRREQVVLTLAGVDPVDLDPAGPECTGVAGAIAALGEPSTSVAVVPAALHLIVLYGRVGTDPAYDWASVSHDLRAALFMAFGYPQRQIGEDVVVSDLLSAAHSVAGVESFSVTGVTFVATTANASDIASAIADIGPPPPNGRLPVPTPPAQHGPTPQSLAFLSDAVTDTLILQQVQN